MHTSAPTVTRASQLLVRCLLVAMLLACEATAATVDSRGNSQITAGTGATTATFEQDLDGRASSAGQQAPRARPQLRGSVCQLFTPFTRNGSLDLAGVRAQISACVLRANVSTVLLTSGDSGFSYMDDSEVRDLTRAVVAHVRAIELRPTVVVAAAPVRVTSKVVEFARFAKGVGADVLMVRPIDDVLPTNGNQGPHRYQPGLVDLYASAAQIMPIQIVGCHAAIEFAVLDEVARRSQGNLCCYKIENGNATYTKLLLQRPSLRNVSFMYGGGSASAFVLPLARVGAGITAGMSLFAQGIAPELDRKVWRAIFANDTAAFGALAQTQAALIDGLRNGRGTGGELLSPSMSDGFPGGLESGLRAALEVQGVSSRYLRAPQDSASDAELIVVKKYLRELGL